eukprot:993844-Rhodomonas_salina.2
MISVAVDLREPSEAPSRGTLTLQVDWSLALELGARGPGLDHALHRSASACGLRLTVASKLRRTYTPKSKTRNRIPGTPCTEIAVSCI